MKNIARKLILPILTVALVSGCDLPRNSNAALADQSTGLRDGVRGTKSLPNETPPSMLKLPVTDIQ